MQILFFILLVYLILKICFISGLYEVINERLKTFLSSFFFIIIKYNWIYLYNSNFRVSSALKQICHKINYYSAYCRIIIL